MRLSRALAAAVFGSAALALSSAYAGIYWQLGVRTAALSLCFVGDAVTSRPARAAQVLRYLKEFEYASNISNAGWTSVRPMRCVTIGVNRAENCESISTAA